MAQPPTYADIISSVDDLAGQLKFAVSEAFDTEDGGGPDAAEAADGALRDAQGTLDKIVAALGDRYGVPQRDQHDLGSVADEFRSRANRMRRERSDKSPGQWADEASQHRWRAA